MSPNVRPPCPSGAAVRCAAAALAALLAMPVGAGAAWADAQAPRPTIRVVTDATGSRLQVDGRDFMVYGMNWDYIPIGQNYAWSLWSQPDDVIRAALDHDMPLLKAMGVNAIRQYVGVPPRWVRYIYERHGIFTILNHPMARYGFTLDGVWRPTVDYSDPRLRDAVEADVLATVDQFRDTPGVLMWLLGNENNYGLTWTSFEIEALPVGERDAARARHLYSLFGRVIAAVKARDPGTPVSMANGDLQYIDLIAEECRGLDVFGTNVYRGISARDLFQVVRDKLGVPMMFTEFGADAFDARRGREDQVTQARYLIGQWREIYEQSAGKGRVGNAIGGLVFQWSDGWWKFGQESRLDLHDTNASWPNGGYPEDFVEGENNMNEEWWGICAKGPADARGLHDVYPRAAYFALRRAFALPAYAPGTDLAAIRAHFDAIDPVAAELEARGVRASLAVQALERVRLTGLRMEFVTYSTGGRHLSTPASSAPASATPSFVGFDRLESFYADVRATPAANVSGTLSLNVLGNVPRNPIDEVFYEARGRPRSITANGAPYTLNGIERLKVYRAGLSWDDRWFTLDGFYRTGHYHWGYEGDFFGLYREANYGPNIDTYNGDAPLGVEVTGKRLLSGVKLAFGPQLWWGANPAFMAKVRRRFGRVEATLVQQNDLTRQTSITSSSAIPQPPTHKTALHLATRHGPFVLEAGGIWSGADKVGRRFQVVENTPAGVRILEDRVRAGDAFGVKAKVTMERGRFRWYAQAASMRPVAEAGPTQVMTFTGWNLKDTGSGNQNNVITGFTYNHGDFQFGPNFLYQKPFIGPIPGDVPDPGRPRNIVDDPFAVRGNRETVAGELLVVYDPTPATWMWAWDNDVREDARFAASLGLVVRHLPTTQDASIGFLADGVTTFAFPGAPPARDLWEVHARIVSSPTPATRVLARLYAGTGEPNGDDRRLVRRFGTDARLAWRALSAAAHVRVNDWGPYDYHRDFNLTFPLQVMGDVSHTLGAPRWLDTPQSRFGVRATWRSLDEHSPRYVAPADGSGERGSEWEIRTYLGLTL